MITMTAEQLKDALIEGNTFTEPITITNTLDFRREIDSKIISLPDNLTVEILDLDFSKITQLPENLNVKILDLTGSERTQLPNNLTVEALNLSASEITQLPKNLNVGALHLWGSKITELPENLIVKNLFIYSSKIKHIPATIKNVKEINVDKDFLPSIPYNSFLICLHFFKNIITVYSESNPTQIIAQQFEQRFRKGK